MPIGSSGPAGFWVATRIEPVPAAGALVSAGALAVPVASAVSPPVSVAVPPVASAVSASSSSSPHAARTAVRAGTESPNSTPRRTKSRRLMRPAFSASTRSIGSLPGAAMKTLPLCLAACVGGNLPSDLRPVNQGRGLRRARTRSSRSQDRRRRACEDGRRMGPGIIIPVVVLSIVLPAVLTVARRRFLHVAAGIGPELGSANDPSVRLTSDALRALATPPWRVVHEIAPARLGGIDHVVIGPPGVLALTTTIEPLPPQPTTETADPAAVA